MRLKIQVIAASALSGILLISMQMRLGAQSETRQRRVNGAARQTQANDRLSTIVASESTELRAELVTYPNGKTGLICGPQLKANSRLNPFPWFDATQINYGHVLGRESPSVPPRTLTGAVNARLNSPVVTGIGTRFRSEVDPNGPAPFYNGWLRISDGGAYREVKVISVESDVALTLTSVWKFGRSEERRVG